MKKKISVVLLLVLMSLSLAACACKHEWVEATCTAPKTCAKCGETEGEPLGHDWAEATCESPKTCKVCGETEGEALGHKWTEAGCTEPETCSVCGKTSGTALGHEIEEWKEIKKASCTENGEKEGVCSRCGETVTEEIEKLPHVESDWKITQKATYDQAGEREKRCTVCGEILQTEAYELEGEEKATAFKNECANYSYKDIARDPDQYKGSKIKFYGEIVQVCSESNGMCSYRVMLSNYDVIYVNYVRQDGESRLLEDDNVTVYGLCNGLYSYTSVQGAKITIPCVDACYIDLR